MLTSGLQWQHDRSLLDRLNRAVETLATTGGSWTKRLERACQALIPLKTQDFPIEVQREFEKIISAVTSDQSVQGAVLHMSVSRMHWKKKKEVASLIIKIFSYVNSNHLTNKR